MKSKKYVSISFIVFMVLFSIKQLILTHWLVEIPLRWFVGSVIIVFTFSFVFYISCIRYRLIKTMHGFYIAHFIYFLGQLAYYNVFKDVLNPLTGLTIIKEVIGTVFNGGVSFNIKTLIVFIDLPFFIVISRNFKYLYDRHMEKEGKKVLRKGRWVLLGIYLIAQISFSLDEPFWIERQHFELLEDQKLIICNGYIVHNWYYWKNSSKNSDLIKRIEYGPTQNVQPATKSKMNVIILQMESLQSGAEDLIRNGEWVMPFLQASKTNSIYYRYMVSYHWGGATSDAEISVLNNVYPFQDYPLMHLKDYDFPNNILHNFKEHGYQVYAFHNNHGRYYNRVVFYNKSGADYFFDKFDMGFTSTSWDAPDSALFNFMKDKQRKALESGKPFFHYGISLTGHQNFNYVNYFTNISLYDDIPNKQTRNFYKTQRYIDDVLKNYIEYVRKNMPDTYVFVFGDHTIYEAPGYFRRALIVHEKLVYEFVPLYIFTPDNQIKNNSEFLPTFHDIGPTVLSLTGKTTDYKTFGQNLFGKELAMDEKRTILKETIEEVMSRKP